MVWWPPASVVTSVPDEKFWTTPISDQGDGGQDRRAAAGPGRTERVRSTQKLPTRSVDDRVKPRISATATAMPTAAETKFCTARPAIWVRWPMVASPEYACQLVLVTNDAAVLNASAGSTPGKPRDSGRPDWTRWRTYSSTTPTNEKASTETAYTDQRWSAFGSTPTRR